LITASHLGSTVCWKLARQLLSIALRPGFLTDCIGTDRRRRENR
jgi:hypothetical protein